MENLAQELLQIGASEGGAENATVTTQRPKSLKCLVYWISDQEVSIVSCTAVQGVKAEDLKEGSIYKVRFQDRKVYDAKLLKMSADNKQLKQMQDEVAVSLAAASQAGARADEDSANCSDVGNKKNLKRKKSTQNENTGKVAACDRPEKKKKTVRNVESTEKVAACDGPKKKKKTVSNVESTEKVAARDGPTKKKKTVRNVDLTQDKRHAAAKAIAEREVFRGMLEAEEKMSAAPEAVLTNDSSKDKHLAADKCSGITEVEVFEQRSVAEEIRATPEALHEKVPEPSHEGFQSYHSSTADPPRLVDMLPPPPSYTVRYPQPMYPDWQDQMSFGERIRDATNTSTSMMDPFQQDQLMAENEHLRQTLRQYENRIRDLEEEKFRLTAVKDLYLPQVSVRELKFLERLTSALGRCSNGTDKDWSEMTNHVAVHPGQSSVVEDAASIQTTSSLDASLSSQHSDTTDSEMTKFMIVSHLLRFTHILMINDQTKRFCTSDSQLKWQ